MTKKEFDLEAALTGLTSADDEQKKQIAAMYKELSLADHDEIFLHCCFVVGYRKGAESNHETFNRRIESIKGMLDVADSQGQQMLDAMKELRALSDTYKKRLDEALKDAEYWKNKYYRA